jgi:hypothetical protein
MMRPLLAGAGALVLAGAGSAATPAAQGRAVIGGATVQLRYAAAFTRSAPDGSSGGYAIVLAAKPVRCGQLAHLPDRNPIGSRWALISLYPTKDGSPPTGAARGEIDYPVDDAYASLARGVTISLASSGPFPGAVWRGRAAQGPRKVEGKVYALNVRFAARWCS